MAQVRSLAQEHPQAKGVAKKKKKEEEIWTHKWVPGTHAHREKSLGGHSKKVAVCKPRRAVTGESNPAHTLGSDFQPPELGES